ncbi:MAG TPA: amidohydrolase family protein [Vicinamibacterales bacterium]|jgi:imidazolonepropionase-like amidohydrolase|nr:amidohydrolase family protein [Vicinamibacterales bacterium]
MAVFPGCRVIAALVVLLVTLPAIVRPQSQVVVFTHANVIDGSGAEMARDMTVTIADGRISDLQASGTSAPPSSARVIDATNKFLIPGLWDMHVHWYDARLLGLFLANGVTGIRVMWGMPLHLEWRSNFNASTLVGPRMFIGSAIFDGPNPVWPRSTVISDAAEAKAAVAAAKQNGYDFIKVYNRLSRDAYFAIAEESARQGLSFAGHVPNAVTAGEASDAHQKSIEHLTGILSSVSSAEAEVRKRAAEVSTAGNAAVGISAESRAALRELQERILATYDAEKASALYARFVRNGTWMCPTLVVLRSGASLDDPSFVADPRLKYMPPGIRTSWDPANAPLFKTKTAADYEVGRRTLRKQYEVVGAMNRAGVRIIAGTDVLNPFVFPGFSLHDELALLVEAGMTPAQALRAATGGAAEFMGRNDVGIVKRGNLADLVLLDANPLENIRNTTRIAAVVANGRLYDRTALDRLLADAEKVANPGAGMD